MKVLLLLLFVVLLPGCMLTGGNTAYTLEPVEIGGKPACCKITVNNSKDYDGFKFKLKKDGDVLEIFLDETGVSASDPAAVAAANQSKLIDAVTKLIPVGN